MTTTTTPKPGVAAMKLERAAQTPPAFEGKRPGESTADYGVRVLRFAIGLEFMTFPMLSDEALEAGADAVTHAVTQKDISQVALACLQALQAALRGSLARRRAERDRTLARFCGPQAGIVAPVAQAAPQAPPAAPGGGGGSKVKRPVKPQGPRPGGFASPDETGQQGSFRRLPALQLSADDSF
jgi:hypothetical protein